MAQTDEGHIRDALRLLFDVVADIAHHLASSNPPIVDQTRYEDWLTSLRDTQNEIDAIRVRSS